MERLSEISGGDGDGSGGDSGGARRRCGGEVFFLLLEAGRISRSPFSVEQWTETGWKVAAELDLAAVELRRAAEEEEQWRTAIVSARTTGGC